MQLSIGNILFYWPKQTVDEFYFHAAKSSAQHIYIGESVCSKRHEFRLADCLELAKGLAQQGKSVVLSSLALIESKSELSSLKNICMNGDIQVEANDFGAVELLSKAGIPFVAGAALNIYNQHDLKLMCDKGMFRWVMPVELSRDWLIAVLQGCEELAIKDKFEVEVYGYGYLPLAYSARCFTARSEKKPKDQCEYCCIKYPQGRKIDNQENVELFRMNGIQTMSGRIQNLMNEVTSMQGLVDIIRISPHSIESIEWIERFTNSISSPETIAMDGFCNGYWHKIEGMKAL